ncbi:MAG: SDR family oxidoreductase [Gammaproteobacteria bacterium]|nr:SDR family oxidoreductase [Gammaproteobacteria bacterium]
MSETVVITGAGSGIGQALAVGFVGAGAHVVAISRGAERLERTRQLCAGPGSIDCQPLDVGNADGLQQLLARLVRERNVDIVINNAAVYPRATLADMTPGEWADGVVTNLNGVAYSCRAAVRALPPERAAIIVNVGSFAYRGPQPGSTLYCATKAAVEAFTRALAVELAAAHSRLIVNHWVPGTFRTSMGVASGDDPRLAYDRLQAVLRLSRAGPGGRTFLGDAEWLPPRSLRSRVRSLLSGRRP